MKKLLNYILKGICIGNILAVISYLTIFFLSGNDGLKITLDNLSTEYNYIRMVIYSSLGGVLVYLLYGYYFEFIFKERKDKDVKKKGIRVGIFAILVFGLTIILGLNVLRVIYNEENFNQIYYVNIIIVIAYLFGVSTFYTLFKSEVNWINNNLKRR